MLFVGENSSHYRKGAKNVHFRSALLLVCLVEKGHFCSHFQHMLNRIIKIAISVALIGLAVWQFTTNNIGNGIFLVLLTSIPILLIFRHEFILAAFWYLRKQNFEKADSFLNRISKPEQLPKRQEAYWYYLKGLMEMNLYKKLSKAENLFKSAMKTGLRMKHDQAMCKINLASIAISKRRKTEARYYLKDVKKMKEAAMFKDQIKQLEMFMKRI